MKKCIVMDARDDVGTVLASVEPGDELELFDRENRAMGTLEALCAIPFAHKVALRALSKGEPVLKYGQVIGRAVKDIRKGDYLHVHNVVSAISEGERA